LDIRPNRTMCPWGNYITIYHDSNYLVRALTINGGESLSLHYHQFRQELWFPIDKGLRGVINGSPSLDLTVGHVYSVQQNVLHRIINPTTQPLKLIEVATGRVDEQDIIIIYDKHRS
jgi:mannose-6-phosphate isomerase-like protein (cupin superfamily)